MICSSLGHHLCSSLFLIFLKLTLIYMSGFLKRFHLFIWQTKITNRQRGRQRERERGKQVPCWAGSPRWVLVPGLWDHDPSWKQRINLPSHSGAPVCQFWIPPSFSFSFNFFKGFIYLEREREEGRGRGRERSRLPTEQGAPRQVCVGGRGLDPRTPRSWPEPRNLNNRDTQAPLLPSFSMQLRTHVLM